MSVKIIIFLCVLFFIIEKYLNLIEKLNILQLKYWTNKYGEDSNWWMEWNWWIKKYNWDTIPKNCWCYNEKDTHSWTKNIYKYQFVCIDGMKLQNLFFVSFMCLKKIIYKYQFS